MHISTPNLSLVESVEYEMCGTNTLNGKINLITQLKKVRICWRIFMNVSSGESLLKGIPSGSGESLLKGIPGGSR